MSSGPRFIGRHLPSLVNGPLPPSYHLEAHRRAGPLLVAAYSTHPASTESKQIVDQIDQINSNIRQWNNDHNLPQDWGTVDIHIFQHAWAHSEFVIYLEGFCRARNYPISWSREPPGAGSEYRPYRHEYWRECNWAVGGILLRCLWELLMEDAEEADDLESLIHGFECEFNRNLRHMQKGSENTATLYHHIQSDLLTDHYRALAKHLKKGDKEKYERRRLDLWRDCTLLSYPLEWVPATYEQESKTRK